jgi:hypothetical protein
VFKLFVLGDQADALDLPLQQSLDDFGEAPPLGNRQSLGFFFDALVERDVCFYAFHHPKSRLLLNFNKKFLAGPLLWPYMWPCMTEKAYTKQIVSFQLEAYEDLELQRIAKEKGLSKSDIIRTAVRKMLGEKNGTTNTLPETVH